MISVNLARLISNIFELIGTHEFVNVNNLQSLIKSCRDVSNNDICDEIHQKAAEWCHLKK